MDEAEEEPLSLVELAERDFALRGIPESSRILPVDGYLEGALRTYLGPTSQTRFLAPPVLLRQGERVLSDWLFRFLQDVTRIRPWLEARMPSFHLTQEEARVLVRWFKIKAGLPSDGELFAAHVYDRDLVSAGRQALEERFQCNSCHPAGDKMPAGDKSSWGPDLGLAAARLRPPWIFDWMKDPPDFMPGTKMPNFFGSAADDPTAAHPLDQAGGGAGVIELMEALIRYLVHMKSVDGVAKN